VSTVLLAGAFGQNNPGDEALLTAFKRGLPDWDLVATSDDPAETAQRHGLRAVHRHRVASVARSVAASDGVVFAGGTVFKTLHPLCGRRRHALLRRSLALAAGTRAFGKPLALVGVGAGDIDGPVARSAVRQIADRCDLLVLRDEESADVLEAAGAATPLRVGADAAWTLFDQAPTQGAAPHGDRVVVALSHLAAGRNLARDLAAGLEPLAAAGLRIELQPWQQTADGLTDDAELGERVAAHLPGAELVAAPAGLLEACESFTSARLVVGLRFHALVAAAAAGVPFVAVAHEPKLSALARRLDQRAVPPAALPGQLAPAALAAVAAGPATRAAVNAEIESADASLQLLRVLLSAGRSAESPQVDGLKLVPEEWVS
jgi:polysaccharide pyruvyl transferase WcaK-like protein